MIDIDAIVDCIKHDAALFASAWNDEHRRHGRGAIVVLSPVAPARGDEVKIEYWTLDEIRASLRCIKAEDEFVYRWILQCEKEGGLPVMILSPDETNPGSYDLRFHRFVVPPD